MSDLSGAIDTNVILRYVLQDHAEQSRNATRLLNAVQNGAFTVTCDAVTLSEAVYVLESFYKAPRQAIVSALLPIVRNAGFIVPDKGRYLLALELYAGPVKHFGDACCCAAAITSHGGRLYSFDRELSNAPGIRRSEEPFTD